MAKDSLRHLFVPHVESAAFPNEVSLADIVGVDRGADRSGARFGSRTVTVDTAAAELGVSRATLYRAIQRGEVPVLRIGRRVVVRRATIERLLADAAQQ